MRQHQVMQIGALMMGSIAIIVSLTTPGWAASSDGTLVSNNQNRNMNV